MVNGNGHIITARNVMKIYDTGTVKVQALKGVDLAIRKGEMVSIMGPSGCGKTTLLNCLSGLDDVTTGSISVEGLELHKLNDDKKTRHRARRMGFVFQFYNLLPVLSAVENVELPLLLSGIRPREARRKAMGVLFRVGLEGWEHHMPSQLSGGQRQRVTLARALVNDPKIVWADEPTGDLDKRNSDEVMELMRELNRRLTMTLVIVTHDPDVAAKCRRIIHMEDGHIVKDVPITAKNALRHPRTGEYQRTGERDAGAARISRKQEASLG